MVMEEVIVVVLVTSCLQVRINKWHILISVPVMLLSSVIPFLQKWVWLFLMIFLSISILLISGLKIPSLFHSWIRITHLCFNFRLDNNGGDLWLPHKPFESIHNAPGNLLFMRFNVVWHMAILNGALRVKLTRLWLPHQPI